MKIITTSPDKFTEWLKAMVPDAYRQVSIEDIRLMTSLGLIKRYKYYSRQDLEIVRAILQYERLREKRIEKVKAIIVDEPRCKRCNIPLPVKLESKRGRPKEYCTSCESSRPRERNRKWRRKKQVAIC